MRHASATRVGWAIALGLFLTRERIAHAAGELMGQIRGRIVEAATDAPVPGATVTATSRNLGDPHLVTTDENGEFLLPSLPIGVYKVEVSYPGVKPMTREILVQPGVTSPVDIKWSAELAQTETTTVVEERPVTNPNSTQTGTVVSPDQMKYISASNRRLTDPMLLVPGVTRGGTSFNLVKGGRGADNRYLIDGLDITDPVTRLPSYRLAYEAMEAQQVVTGGFDAEYNVFGGIVNTITREGTDEWHGSASVYAEYRSLSNRTPQGLFSNERDRIFFEEAIAQSYVYINTLSISGPIVKHRLWFSATMEYRYNPNGKLPGPPLNLVGPPTIVNTYLPRFKVSWAPSPKQRLGLALAADPEPADNQDAGFTRLGVAQNGTRQTAVSAILTWNIFFSPAFEFRLGTGIKNHNVRNGPQGYLGEVDTRDCQLFSPRNCTYDREAPAQINRVDQSVWYNATADYNDTSNLNIQIDPTITWRGRWLGQHSTKLGAQFKYLRNRTYQHRPGFYQYSDNNGGPLEQGVCDPDNGKTAGCDQRTFREDRRFFVRGINPALFLQDHWRVLNWLTLTPGIRADWGQSRLDDGTQFHSQFALGPRIGAVLDLTGDEKTIFSAHYGRATDVNQIEPAREYQRSLVGAETIERWNPITQQWDFQLRSGGEGGDRFERNAKAPHQDQFTTRLSREIYRNTVLGVEHTWKRMANLWRKVDTNVIWDPTGFRVVDYADGTPHSIYLYTTPDNATRSYHGITLWTEGRPTPKWYFFAAYTVSWAFGTSSDNLDTTSEFRIPQQLKFANGFLPEDNRHQLQMAANYHFPFGLSLGPRLEYRSGSPQNKTFQAIGPPQQTINRRSPRGTDPGTCAGNVPGQGNFSPATTVCDNSVGLIAEYRLPPRLSVDLHFSYDLYPLLGQHIAIDGDVFNVFNDRSPTNLQQNENQDGTFGLVNTNDRNAGFAMRLGARYDF